jgi:hypothetical protein
VTRASWEPAEVPSLTPAEDHDLVVTGRYETASRRGVLNVTVRGNHGANTTLEGPVSSTRPGRPLEPGRALLSARVGRHRATNRGGAVVVTPAEKSAPGERP